MAHPFASEEQLRQFLGQMMGDIIAQDENAKAFLFVMARLLSRSFNKLQEFSSIRDASVVDEEFLEFLWQEFGQELPDVGLSRREWIQESREWYQRKGTKKLFDLIGLMTQTTVEITRPSVQILRLDDPSTLLSGADDDSKVGYLHDGVYWAFYVYVIHVRNAQRFGSRETFLRLLDLNHPAGTKRFHNFYYNFANELPRVPKVGYMSITHTEQLIQSSFARLDVNFQVDELSLLSGRSHVAIGTVSDSAPFKIISFTGISFSPLGLRRSILNPAYAEGDDPAEALSMWAYNGVQYVRVFARQDNDGEINRASDVVLNQVETLLKLKDASYGRLKNAGVTFGGIKNATYDTPSISDIQKPVSPMFYGVAMKITQAPTM